MTRRGALTAVAAAVGYLFGKPTAIAGQQIATPRGLALPLDGIDAILVRYRGQTVAVTPQEIMDALGGSPGPQPWIQQTPYGQGAPAPRKQ